MSDRSTAVTRSSVRAVVGVSGLRCTAEPLSGSRSAVVPRRAGRPAHADPVLDNEQTFVIDQSVYKSSSIGAERHSRGNQVRSHKRVDNKYIDIVYKYIRGTYMRLTLSV